MQVQSAKEVALLVREARRSAALSQQSLADLIGASRQWVQRLEAGVPGVEIGLALRALRALGLAVDIRASSAASIGVTTAASRQDGATLRTSTDDALASRTTHDAAYAAPVRAPDIHAVLARHRRKADAVVPPSAARPRRGSPPTDLGV